MKLATDDTGGRIPSDNQLMVEVKAGSARAFGELYDRHSAEAYQVARGMCADAGRAEKIVEAAFVSIWRNRTSYHEETGTVTSWLLTAVLDTTRAVHEPVLSATDDRSAAQSSSEQTGTSADARAMWALLDRLPVTERQIIALALSGLTHAEIAARLELPDGTVNWRMRLGLEKLRTDIEREVA